MPLTPPNAVGNRGAADEPGDYFQLQHVSPTQGSSPDSPEFAASLVLPPGTDSRPPPSRPTDANTLVVTPPPPENLGNSNANVRRELLPDRSKRKPQPSSLSPGYFSLHAPNGLLTPGHAALWASAAIRERKETAFQPPAENDVGFPSDHDARHLDTVNLPPLPSPTFSEMFYFEQPTPRIGENGMPQILLTPADGCGSYFWGTDDAQPAPSHRQAPSLMSAQAPSEISSAAISEEKIPTGLTNCQRALCGHEPGLADELAVSPGDALQIYKRFKDGWILGRNITQNTRGVFPSGCLTFRSPTATSLGSNLTPPTFMSSSSRQDSNLSTAMSFRSSASAWLYGPDKAPSSTVPTVVATKKHESRNPFRKKKSPASTTTAAADSTRTLAVQSLSVTGGEMDGSGGGVVLDTSTTVLVEVPAHPKHTGTRRRPLPVSKWQKMRRPVVVGLAMIVAFALVLGLGLGLGKVRPAAQTRALHE
ncbi:hypothetical protein HKX48_007269 [Thoreauomyces humboldtii]|nr:hypothetical protein HKX48_007269 [Thoreauomyces humboldtii]